jgi:hypothetical protein
VLEVLVFWLHLQTWVRQRLPLATLIQDSDSSTGTGLRLDLPVCRSILKS